MQAPMWAPVSVQPIQPTALATYLPMAMAGLRELADPALEVMCSITSALRLHPETSTAPGLNPYHVALTDVTVSSAALQGHLARAAAGDSSPQLQQAIVHDAMSWPMLQTEMMHNWELYRCSAGPALGGLPAAVAAWNRQVARGYQATLEAVVAAVGPGQFRALIPTVWAPIGMNRF